MRRIFWGFCRNWFRIDPVHYLLSSSDFGFEFTDIFVIEKRLCQSAFECLKENSASRGVAMVSQRVAIRIFFTFIIKLQHFKRLNQPFKRSIWQKRSQRCNVLSPLIYLEVWKNCIFRQSCQLGESGSCFSIRNISANLKPKSKRLKT